MDEILHSKTKIWHQTFCNSARVPLSISRQRQKESARPGSTRKYLSYAQVIIEKKTFSNIGGFGNGLHHPWETHTVHSTILHAQICYDYAWAAFRRWCNNSWRPFLGNKKGQSVEHPFFSNYCSTLKRNQIDMNHKKTRKNDIDLKTNWLCNIIFLSIANANNIVFAFA